MSSSGQSMSGSKQQNLPLRQGDIGANAPFLIEDVYPAVDAGRYPIKRVAGQSFDVWADVFRGGHDIVRVDLIWRREGDTVWQRSPMSMHSNDRWTGRFTPTELGHHEYAIEAWTDVYATWRHGVELKQKAGQPVELGALEGAALIAKSNVTSKDAINLLLKRCDAFMQTGSIDVLMDDDVAEVMGQNLERQDLTRSRHYPLVVERERAINSAWYEMVPRSQSLTPGKHGTFQDCIARLPDIAAMGFDVLYFTPIHPIGVTNRKGRNNALKAEAGDPGSPYAIGAPEGGHDAIHPELGTFDDFQRLIEACRQNGLEVALDIAVQCSPDHPWLTEHPNWFQRRPDGSMRYAENPPKKYEDIHNPDFNCEDAGSLWNALRDVFLFWVDKGVRIFRVDNPHTKPFHFWEWVIREVQRKDPGVIFLSEAFTRPKLMKGLAKLGFSQSYTYFTWRTSKWEIEAYLNELTGYPERDYYRPNFFVSTPDILPFHLQSGEPWIFKSRVALASMLSGSYGIYNGFELLEHAPIPGKEEYLHSEKYEIKTRDWNKPGNIKEYITALNFARRASPALQQTRNLRFLPVQNDQVIGFVKWSNDERNVVTGAISLSRETQDVWLPLHDVQVLTSQGKTSPVALENLLNHERHPVWSGGVHIRVGQRDPAFIARCLA